MFIVFEGLDGSGQSTQAELLYEYLTSRGKKVLLTKEPTNTIFGGIAKSCLKKELNLSPMTLQLLFATDRSHHLEKEILPALETGKIVISDRYFFSSIAYGSLDVEMDFLMKINSKFKVPDLIFFLDVPPKICIKRISNSRNGFELFEEEKKLEKVRENYLKIWSKFKNVFKIDGTKEKEKVFEEIREIIDKKVFKEK
ncbi:MAG: dTMP kinase [archaeon]